MLHGLAMESGGVLSLSIALFVGHTGQLKSAGGTEGLAQHTYLFNKHCTSFSGAALELMSHLTKSNANSSRPQIDVASFLT